MREDNIQLEKARAAYQALDHQCVISLNTTLDYYDNPQMALKALLDFEVAVATDHRVNGNNYQLHVRLDVENIPQYKNVLLIPFNKDSGTGTPWVGYKQYEGLYVLRMGRGLPGDWNIVAWAELPDFDIPLEEQENLC